MVRRALQVWLASHPRMYLRGLQLLRRGSLEKRLYLALLRRGDVAFDIGANLGYFTLLFSDIVGQDGEVHAFEPVPPTFDALGEFVRERRRYENVLLTGAACGDRQGRASIYVPGADAGQASLRCHADGSWRGCQAVREYSTDVITLDDYVRDRRMSHLDFVKCDIEGAELLALRGMARTTECCRPMLLVEVYSGWSATFGYGASSLVEFLGSIGYDDFRWVTDRVWPAADAAGLRAVTGSGNLLCGVRRLHAGRLDRLRIL